MAVRKSEAEWKGDLLKGQGTMKLGSGAFEGSYSFPSRFESGKGTNPEELIGAAHAGCFSMALSAGLGKAGFTPTRIHTTATVHLEKVVSPSRASSWKARRRFPGSMIRPSRNRPRRPRRGARSPRRWPVRRSP